MFTILYCIMLVNLLTHILKYLSHFTYIHAGKSCEELAGFSDDSKHERLLSGDATTAAVDVADWRSVSGESNASTSKRI